MSDEEEEDWGEDEEEQEEETPAEPEEAEEEEEEEEAPPPPPAEEEVVEEEEEPPKEEEKPPQSNEGRFVVGCEGNDGLSEEERKVEYQAALSMVLLGELQSGDKSVVALAAQKLDDFFQIPEHAKHTDCFCALGGHGLLLMLIQKWKDEQSIQERLFSCLSQLCIWARNNTDTPANPNIISTILIMRGMELIADSMKRFPDSSKLYVDCLGTITCLCRKQELDRHSTTRTSITGAVPLVCMAIKSFPDNRDVLHSGCRALKAFCEMKLDQIKNLKGEAISVVGAALQNFPDDTEINMIAFSFLRNLGDMCGYGAKNDTSASNTSTTNGKTNGNKEEHLQEEHQVQNVPVVPVPKKKWGGGINVLK